SCRPPPSHCPSPSPRPFLSPHTYPLPTRRSSDLSLCVIAAALSTARTKPSSSPAGIRNPVSPFFTCSSTAPTAKAMTGRDMRQRSEEHTSELQSRLDLVCRLLLEKETPKGPPIGP